MQRKIIFGLVTAVIAVPVFASLLTVWSTNGRGIASGAGTTQGARFRVNAHQTGFQGTMTVAGDFFLEMCAPPPATELGLNSPPPGISPPRITPTPPPSPPPIPPSCRRLNMHVTAYNLGNDPNAVQLTGPAVLRVPTSNGYQDYQGSASANLVSNHHADEMGDPDTLEVHFVPATTGDPNLDFAGAVTSGDITIGKTDSY